MKIIHLTIAVIFTIFCSSQIEAQIEYQKGTVSFITSNDIYAKFTSTADINIGDTLFLSNNGTYIPCLLVTKKSSTSTVNVSLENCLLKINENVYHQIVIVDEIETPTTLEDIPIETPEIISGEAESVDENPEENKKKTDLRGRLSAATYSNLTSRENSDAHRIMIRASLNATRINDSKFSAESYVNYRQNFLEREVADDYQTKFLRLYSLAITYEVDSTMWITAGRKINRKISSIGAVDGIQSEKQIGNFYVGGIVGFKPDLFKFDFNTKFFEYGVYGGFSKRSPKNHSQTTVGFLELRNSGIVDRRYTYLQHSSNINRKLNLFSSIELDLYQQVAGSSSTNPRLTNLYVSMRYKFSRAINVTLSYDNRKRIIYYETFRTDIERLLADDEARQGIRTRINIKPFKLANTGFSYSKRFQANGLNASDNMNVFFSYSKLPFIKGRISLNYNMNSSTYLQSQIYSIRHSRTLIPRKLNGDFYYRNIRYNYVNSENEFQQNYLGASLTYRINKSLSLGLMGELSRRTDESNYRINTRLIKRIR